MLACMTDGSRKHRAANKTAQLSTVNSSDALSVKYIAMNLQR